MSRQRTFAICAAIPFSVLAAMSIIGAGRGPSDGTAVADPILVVHDAQSPIPFYLAPGADGSTLVRSKYGTVPRWHAISSGSGIVPSPITRAGDLVFINAEQDPDRVDLTVRVGAVDGQTTRFVSCLVPLRLWSSMDDGQTWDDITGLLTDGVPSPSEKPFYLDCARGEAILTVPTAAGVGVPHQQYELSVEAGGSLAAADSRAPLVISADVVPG